MAKKFPIQPMKVNQAFDDPFMQSMYNEGRKMIVDDIYCMKCGKPIENISDINKSRTDFMKERKNKIHDACLYEVYKTGHYQG